MSDTAIRDDEQNLADHVSPSSSEFRPIVSGFHPDPTICRVGDEYYLAHSSFEYFPAAPIFHSRDLVTWQQIGNILDRRSQFRHGAEGPSTGIYGSTLRHHDGRFWFVTTNVSSFDDGQMIVHAEDAAGPWSEPVFVPDAIGIDPDLTWDHDGTCYLTWHDLDFERGGKGVLQAPVDLATGRLLEQPYPVWQGSGLPAAEGPHLHRREEFWYQLLAEGGTERGHSVTVARAPSPRGPWEAAPSNPIFTRRSTVHPVQSVGHADLVEAPDGGWATVFLGTRPRGSTPGFHVLGRETFLARVDWVDGWPVIDPGGFQVPEADTEFVDTFEELDLHPRWVVPGGDPALFSRALPGGGLALEPMNATQGLLCARVRNLAWRAVAEFSVGGALSLHVDERHWARLRWDNGRVLAEARIGGVQQVLSAVKAGDGATMVISAQPPSQSTLPFGAAGPDEIVLAVESGGERIELARLDGRYFSTEVAAGFTGRMLAVSASHTPARLSRFAYTPVGEGTTHP